METDGRTIIISTPEELFPLITEAVRLAGYENARNTSDCPNQKLLAPKDVEREFGHPPEDSRLLASGMYPAGIYEFRQARFL